MKFFPILASLALDAAMVGASPALEARTTTPLRQFWAYGTNVSGLPLFNGDGRVYLGDDSLSTASVATNVTFDLTDGSLIATPLNTTLARNWTSPRLYINTSEGAFSDAGFTNSNTSTTAVTSTDFSTLGTLLVWSDDSGDIESPWYAEPVNGTELWTLQWNVDNTVTGDNISVVLKTLKPVSRNTSSASS